MEEGTNEMNFLEGRDPRIINTIDKLQSALAGILEEEYGDDVEAINLIMTLGLFIGMQGDTMREMGVLDPMVAITHVALDTFTDLRDQFEVVGSA